jgi:hypothetical protein
MAVMPDFGSWNVYVYNQTQFDYLSAANSVPRMISASDNRHLGTTSLVFFDSHTEAVKLTPQRCPFSLVNPLQTIRYP